MDEKLKQSYYDALEKAAFTTNPEKSFVDKVIGRQDIERIKKLIRRDDLTKADISELLNLLAGAEIKLVNFGDWDRYLLAKFFPWIGDITHTTEKIYDLLNTPLLKDLGPEVEEIAERIRKNLEYLVRFMVDYFLFLSRSTLSLGGTAFDTLTTNRFEYNYPQQQQALLQQPQQSSNFKLIMPWR